MHASKAIIPNPSPHFIPLDGLRGLAVLLVVFGHFFYKFQIFQLGWSGLNLFFVLSGYLITQRLFYHRLYGVYLYFRNFYSRRILRIFPLYYGCLLFFFLILPLFYKKFHFYFDSVYNIQAWYWFYISNWRYYLYGLPGNPVFFHFWSLAVEEQFYLIWPILFLYISTCRSRIILILTTILFSIFFRSFFYGSGSSYYNSITGAEPLLLGCLICILEKEGRLIPAVKIFRGLAILSVFSLIFIFATSHDLKTDNQMLFTIGYLNFDLLWSYLLILLIHNPDSNSIYHKISITPMLVWLGVYSYGIYVFHWIILQLFVYKYEGWLTRHGYEKEWAFWITRSGGIAMTLLISIASYHLIEKKFLRLKKFFY